MEYIEKNYDYIGVIELDNGYYFHVIKYDSENGFYLDAGTATNILFLSSYRIECSNDDSIDVALSELYEIILEDQQESQEV